MKAKLIVLGSVLSVALTAGYFSVAAADAKAAPCKRTKFETVAVKDACARGGQKAAKEDMKKFLKTAKAKNPAIAGCPTCHSKVAGDYPLKANGLQLYKDAGGK